MHTILLARESDGQRVEASVEAWVLAVYSTLTPAQKASAVDRVLKIDREAVRTGTSDPTTFASQFAAGKGRGSD